LPDTSKLAAPETLPIKPPTSVVPVTLLPVAVLNAWVPENVPPPMLPTKPPTDVPPDTDPELIHAPVNVLPTKLPAIPPTATLLASIAGVDILPA